MNPIGWKQKGYKLRVSGAVIVCLCVGMFFLDPFDEPLRANQTASADENVTVLKGKEPVLITGTVVAMTRAPWMGLHWSVHILLIRVDSSPDGEKPERYVRADFLQHSIYDDSEESRAYDKLVRAFHEKGTWKIQLHPPRSIPECWKVPPPPKSGDLITYGNPDIRPVGGATGYPNVNAVPCYAVTPADVQEIRSPGADQNREPGR